MLAASLCSQVLGAEIWAVPSHPSHATEADVTVMAGELCSCSALHRLGLSKFITSSVRLSGQLPADRFFREGNTVCSFSLWSLENIF